MDTTDNSASSSPAPGSTAAARRSGRVTKAPDKFIPDAPTTATKRKRGPDHDDDDAENESPDEEEDGEDDDADDSTADEQEGQPRKAASKKKASSQTTKAKKPAAKKPKVNGDAPVAVNHTSKLPSRPRKNLRISVAQRDGDELYAEIFGSGESPQKVATDWYHAYRADDAAAVTNLINCLLLAAGCDQRVTQDDIRDPENSQNRLADLQNVYTEEGIIDYPLIARTKTTRSFRELLVGFFKSLVNIMHETELLYKDKPLMDNIARWVASMSSSTLRPFRHTATTVALTMETALVEVSKKLDDRITKTTQQLDAEKSRKGKNKERLAAIQASLDEATKNSEVCQEQITDFFDTVFVHRYRDIDSKIRTECVEALGTWVWVLPTMFMKPEYLRYLGWMLSDAVPSTRHEVLKQLSRIFKRDAEKLGHFIDRFRPRLVEIATRDSDVSVRAAAVDVVVILKNIGMLEPDDIDAMGKLVFDSEIRVRRAVISFFVDCVNDSIESKIEELGGNEAVDELFGKEEEDEYETPRRDWISIKCLAEILAAYETQLEEEEGDSKVRRLDIAIDLIEPAATVTRVSMASQILCEKIDHVRNWELLAGYLLYDHSASSRSRSKVRGNTSESALRKAVAPEGREETVLIEVLSASVKQSLGYTAELEKGKRRARIDGFESREDNALRLANTIPRLLRKFGSEPRTAVLILQLSQVLDLEALQQLRQDSSAFSRLLDEVCTQFSRHVDKGVLAEVAATLSKTRQHDELEEIVDSKISLLWDNVINSLRNFDKLSELTVRGNLDGPAVSELGNVATKVSKLAAISNCIDVFETEGQSEESSSPAIELLIRIVHRGRLVAVDEELDDLEDEVVSFAIKSCQLYFMWKVRSLVDWIHAGASISTKDVSHLNALRGTYVENLTATFTSRGTNDELRLFATGYYCDLFVLFASLRQVIEQTPDGLNKYASLSGLFEESDPILLPEFLEIFEAAEATYAKRARKTVNEPADDEDPIDVDDPFSDGEDEKDQDNNNNNNSEEQKADKRKEREVRAERMLCELAAKFVMAILARMVDRTGPHAGRLRRRMLRNQSKLGANFKDVLAFLDEDRLRDRTAVSRGASGKKKAAAKSKGKQPASSGAAAATAAADGKKKPLSEEIITAESDDDEDVKDAAEMDVGSPLIEDIEPEPEEGTVEDLRRRELLDDPIDDDEEKDGDDAAGGDNEAMEEESILGD